MSEDFGVDYSRGFNNQEVSPEVQGLFGNFIANADLYSLTGQSYGGLGSGFSDIATKKTDVF